MTRSRLQELYKTTLKKDLQKKLGFKNSMQVPQIDKIVLNVGVNGAVQDSRALLRVEEVLGRIAGQKPVRTVARKSIAGFKLREGMPIGVMVTLRKRHMYEFLDRLVNLALPNIKDFQGLPTKLDRRGNYNIGLKEWSVFPEVGDVAETALGLNITIATTTDSDEHAKALLESFGMPFKKKQPSR